MNKNARAFAWQSSLLAILAFCVSSGGALSQNYHPLDIGAEWQYYSTEAGHQTMSITGQVVVLGTVVLVRHQEETTQVYENYWTRDASGNLFLHGAQNFTYPFEIAYLPPIRMVDAPLSIGRTWTTYGIRTYYLDGTPMGEAPFDYALRVYSEGPMQVPAGEFYAYGVGYDSVPPRRLTTAQGTFDVFGREVQESRLDNTTHWYAVDVGLVQQYDFRLLSYALPPVAVLPTSWGGLKAMFAPSPRP